MSYDVHEAFCLDSFMDQLLFFEDFEGDSIKALWRTTGTGSAAVVDQQDGGIIRIITGTTTTDQYTLDWNDIRSLHVDKKVTFESRFKMISTTQLYGSFGLYYDADNRILFYLSITATPNAWRMLCEDDGGLTNTATTTTVDADYHIYRIECFPAGEVHFYIDGVEVANSPITTNIPDDATDYLQPYFNLYTREGVAKSMDIDYVYIRQER